MEKDLQTRNFEITDQLRDPKTFPFIDNKIKTSRYNIFTFLPKNLFEQFRRLANFYFLVVIILEYFPFSPLNASISVAPLVFVLAITAIREAYEDIQRHKTDKKINNSPASIFRNGQFLQVKWRDIQVGDIVKITNGEFIPADVVVISSSEPMGMCYIDTCNLDGETNLKIHQSLKETAHIKTHEDCSNFLGNSIECELPNNRLYRFEGTLTMNNSQHSLAHKQIILRGCSLRNTKWILGVIVYTGRETKLMKNSTQPPSKRSSLEIKLNSRLISIFIFLGIISIIGSIFAAEWQRKWGEKKAWYMGGDVDTSMSPGIIGIQSFFSFIIVCNVMIPISLYVTMEMVKLIQTIFINHDKDMYHDETETYAKARTSNLAEDLGVIEYIFSDKTGTLTQNVMEFMKCSVGGIMYGEGITEVARAAAKRLGKELPPRPQKRKMKPKQEDVLTNNLKKSLLDYDDDDEIELRDDKELNLDEENENETAFVDDRFLQHLRENNENAHLIHEFILMLAVCHTVIPEENPNNPEKIIYQASSPDEGALVKAGRYFGYEFQTRTPDSVTISVNGQKKMFELLNVLEFNSKRKRMSVIVKDPEEKIIIYTKGADNVIYERLAEKQPFENIRDQTTEHLETFGKEGLRTLCFAMREVEKEEYESWNKVFHEASISLEDRTEKLEKAAEMIENNLILVGASAIEDKLQDGVPEAIELLSHAGIKIWVLTGDKQETAINIGFACSLLTSEMTLIIIDGEDPDEIMNQINQSIKEHNITTDSTKKRKLAVIIQGSSLEHALKSRVKLEFLTLAQSCMAIICCRVSPLQKALVVKLVKDNVNAMTLAIGDGANDVSMIQASHIGIGISGQEGMQAVLASDYSIAQFRFLSKLLLVHGRWSYRRNTKLILYSFYKNMAFSLIQIFFAMFSAWSAQTLFDSILISIYNVVFTSLPIIVYSVFEQDVSQDAELKYPQLYEGGNRESLFGFKRFWIWLLQGIFHALILFFVPMLVWRIEPVSSDGKVSGIWGMSIAVYSSLVIVVNLKIAIECSYWTWIHHVTIWGSIVVWFLAASILSSSLKLSSSMYDVTYHVFGMSQFWFILIFVPVFCLLPDFFYKYFTSNYNPLDFQVIRRFEVNQKKRIPTKQTTKPVPLVEDELEISSDHEKVLELQNIPQISVEKSIKKIVKGKSEKHTGFAFEYTEGTSLQVISRDRALSNYQEKEKEEKEL
ncbi:putative phospholipid-transporting atpase [Anaeramoeba ignava]|uniref:Phospholipid-transporting ATPase n=1 Tax=Anaeramoeba ignava TaxID=1746090 RepID=A0A9Q0R4D3_ANAIG|nr:putative phospholipid-transporting atpase [Anaeramoeba ignava]